MNEAVVAAATTTPTIGQPLEDGIYAGLTIHNEEPMRLVLLPEEFTGTWKQALAWAKKRGAELPTRMDLLAMWNNVRDGLEGWHWSSEEVASDPDYAWCQCFSYGSQYASRKVNRCRARALRRVPIR